jgi:hypothetical protein
MRKKKWKKPQLIVLVRGKSEESVLTNCKWDFVPAGPASQGACCNVAPCTARCFDQLAAS